MVARKSTTKKAASPTPKPKPAEDKPEQTWVITPEGKRVKSEDYEG